LKLSPADLSAARENRSEGRWRCAPLGV